MIVLLSFLLSVSSAAPLRFSQQIPISICTILNNAGRPDVRPGMVVASPSRRDPDYYYDWVRDTALTMRSLIDYYEVRRDPQVRSLLFKWVAAEAYRQEQYSLTDLGEPKYHVDGSAFMGPWGRPQNDGPALRAINMMKWARILLREGQTSYVRRHLYQGVLQVNTVIKKDLEYTAHHWREASFDLWEEEKGMHFYTLLAQYTALQEGSKLAREQGDTGAAQFYDSQARQVGHYILTGFLNAKVGILVTKDKVASLGYKNSGLDIAPLLALLHTWPYQKLIPLTHENVKRYISVLLQDARAGYAINRAYPDLGIALGRYPEDRYDGYSTGGSGNPWFLSTLGLGEFHCLQRQDKARAQLQFARAMFHADRGHISEQFNRETGFMQGAPDLTWSHNAVLTAALRCGEIR